jgi:hypothetical protein
MPTNDPNNTLSSVIERFITDTGLAHDFVKGDENLDVVGSEGTYPSLAKIAKQARQLVSTVEQAVQIKLQEMAGLKVIKYAFDEALQVNFKHDSGANYYDITIIGADGVIVHAPHAPVDDNNIVVDFNVPEGGVAILKLYTSL